MSCPAIHSVNSTALCAPRVVRKNRNSEPGVAVAAAPPDALDEREGRVVAPVENDTVWLNLREIVVDTGERVERVIRQFALNVEKRNGFEILLTYSVPGILCTVWTIAGMWISP